ncbi:hypothetical protein [Azospirillum doebereinerae]
MCFTYRWYILSHCLRAPEKSHLKLVFMDLILHGYHHEY